VQLKFIIQGTLAGLLDSHCFSTAGIITFHGVYIPTYLEHYFKQAFTRRAGKLGVLWGNAPLK
jgi:hypothetical protein